jgi:8-oxo-dGTP pyrophosphatase MutT (NUDIX family)
MPRDAGVIMDAAGLRRRLAATAAVQPMATSDGRLLVTGDLRGAAVLVPVIDRPDGLSVLFTRRTEHLKNHPGQIAFPGGRAELTDTGPASTALREAEEEIALDPATVEVLEPLSDYTTVSGYRVTPVVGLVQPPRELRSDPNEVAEIFEVPLAHLLDPANHQQNTLLANGLERRYYAIPYKLHYIWGATAGMLMNLYLRLCT